MDLLAVDWDFFFPSPMAGGPAGANPRLYAWPVAEDEFHTETVWEARAKTFLAAGIDLPRCADYSNFWTRFSFSERVVLVYADSNAWAGQLFPSNLGSHGPWRSVHLYDAHHDCGYPENHPTFEHWKQGGSIRCEDWMLAHAWAGSELQVHFPPWRQTLDHPTESPLIDVPMSIDGGVPPDAEFDMVFLCRSGAWVPPWCDDQFEEFMQSAPMPQVMHPGNQWVQPRPDVLRAAEMKAALYAKVESSGLDSSTPKKRNGPARGFVIPPKGD